MRHSLRHSSSTNTAAQHSPSTHGAEVCADVYDVCYPSMWQLVKKKQFYHQISPISTPAFLFQAYRYYLHLYLCVQPTLNMPSGSDNFVPQMDIKVNFWRNQTTESTLVCLISCSVVVTNGAGDVQACGAGTSKHKEHTTHRKVWTKQHLSRLSGRGIEHLPGGVCDLRLSTGPPEGQPAGWSQLKNTVRKTFTLIIFICLTVYKLFKKIPETPCACGISISSYNLFIRK